MKTLDVSHWQTGLDYRRIFGAVDALIVKASQGEGGRDPSYAQHIGAARAARKPRASYHFAGTQQSDGKIHVGDPAKEAANYLTACGHQPGEVTVLDFEPTAWPGDPDGWCAAFLAAVRAHLDVTPMLYMSESSTRAAAWGHSMALQPWLWVARYGPNNGTRPQITLNVGPWRTWVGWQYTSAGTVPGFGAHVDLSDFDTITPGMWTAYGTPGGAPKVPAGPPAVDPAKLRPLAYGMKGDPGVARLQRALNAYPWRPPLPLLPVTGNYLDQTAAVIHAAGKQMGVTGDADGRNVGPAFGRAFAARGISW
jgi:GH25 family lysozyme M1 (1,4-beta-N-acetylmuramidase)